MARHSKARSGKTTARFIIRPLFAALVASGVVAPHAAQAATIAVTTGGDAGGIATCTLRQAVASINDQVNAGSCSETGTFGTNDTVDLTGLAPGTITLGGTQIPVTRGMLIQGPGHASMTVSGGASSRVFSLEPPGPPFTFDVSALTIANGRAPGPGGCIGGYGFVRLTNAVVTGCASVDDPVTPFLDSIGGGIAAIDVELVNSTVSGNTATNAGGGIFGKYVTLYRSVVANNTVTGQTCNFEGDPKYCILTVFGGGGIITGAAQLIQSTVSGNLVRGSRLVEGVEGGESAVVGLGGGITVLGKYSGGGGINLASARVKGGVFGNRDAGARNDARAKARASFKASRERFLAPAAASALAKGGKRNKADGFGNYTLSMYASTLSGNRVGDGSAGNAYAKYGGGGAFVFSQDYNAEVANSTISGNSLHSNGANNAGAALFVDSVELTSSTVTGNTGADAIAITGKYETLALAPTGKTGKRKTSPAFTAWKGNAKARVSAWRQESQLKAGRAVLKAAGPPIFYSTIVAGNSGGVDVACFDCTIGGSNNLIRTKDPTTTVPPDTIQNLSANLAPLANNGGVIAGAPGHALTGPNRTRLLYTTSPAVNTGINIENFVWDQRGSGFARVIGPAADMGATEGAVQAPTPGGQAIDPAHAIPALGPWLLGLLSAMLGAIGVARRRRPS